jgi:hypothetical protein
MQNITFWSRIELHSEIPELCDTVSATLEYYTKHLYYVSTLINTYINISKFDTDNFDIKGEEERLLIIGGKARGKETTRKSMT